LLYHCMVNPPGGPGGPAAVFTGVLFFMSDSCV